MSQPPPDSGPRPAIGADAITAGAGGGTLLAVLGNNLSDHYWFKSWIVILAPFMTVAIGYVWTRTRFWVEDWSEQRRAESAFHRAQATLRRALADPDISERHKERTRKELEDLELAFLRNTTRRARLRLPPEK